MKKVLALGSAAISSLLLAAPAFAQNAPLVNTCPDNLNSTEQYNVLCKLNPSNALPSIFTWIIIIAIVLALAFLIWGGIRWILSGGDKHKVETARGTIIAAIVGLLVIFLAWFVINLITGVFFNKSLSGGLQLPQIKVTGGSGPQPTCVPVGAGGSIGNC